MCAEAVAECERVQRDNLAMRRRIALADEEERREVARQLHDGAGQHVTTLALGLQALADLAPVGSEIERRAAELSVLVNATAQDLHALAVRLRPKSVEDFGLAAAVEGYASGWARQTGIALDLHLRIGATRLPSDVEIALYRIVQAALINVAKHSGAGAVSLVVERRRGTLCAVITDDGRGFDTDVLRRPIHMRGLGLPGISERAALLGGFLEIESEPGAGTTLSIRIPVDIMSPETESCIGGNGGCD